MLLNKLKLTDWFLHSQLSQLEENRDFKGAKALVLNLAATIDIVERRIALVQECPDFLTKDEE